MIESDRLFLRPFCEEDRELICRIYSDEDILYYTPYDIMSEKEAEDHLRRVIQDWRSDSAMSMEMAGLEKKTGEKIGRTHILIDPETDTGMIGWFLLKDYWGKHYATEITRTLIDYCFHILNLQRVNAVCNPGNIASWKVLEHCGMRREAYLRQKCRYRKYGQDYWADELEYAILASEWLTDVGCKLEK